MYGDGRRLGKVSCRRLGDRGARGIEGIREKCGVAGSSKSSPKISCPFCADMWRRHIGFFHLIDDGGLVGVVHVAFAALGRESVSS